MQSALPFSKFDPHRPATKDAEASTPSGARRIMILRWVNPLVFAYTAMGFGFIVYWSARKWTPHPLAFTLLSGGTAVSGYALGRFWLIRGQSRLHTIAWATSLLATVTGFALMAAWLLSHW